MRNRFQFLILFLETYIKKHRLHLFLSFVIGLILSFGFYFVFPYLGTLNKYPDIVIGYVGQINERQLPSSILNKISYGLTSINQDGSASPAAAKSWDVDNNGLVYQFYLSDDLKWSDQTPVNASDIQYRFRDVSVESQGKDKLIVKLKDPFTPLPNILTKPILKLIFVGLGPYKVVNTHFTGENLTQISLYPITHKNLPPITYKIYSSLSDAILAFKLGEINRLEDLTDPMDLKEWKNASVIEKTQLDRVVGLFFNLKKDEFKDKEVRQAFGFATPVNPSFEKAISPISPDSWAYTSKVKIYRHDPDAAEKILSKSPFASESAQLVLSTIPSLLSTAQEISTAWNNIGIHSRIKVIRSQEEDFDILLTTQSIPSDPDQYPYWQSTQTESNITGYSNQKIDKLLEDGRKERDIETRKKIYADFQRYLVDDAPAIFLYYPKSYTIVRK